MDFLELARKRYSVRSFKPDKVEIEKLDKILEAGRVAPTANNAQPQRILVLTSDEKLKLLAKAARTFDAPLVLVICAERESAWIRRYDRKSTVDIDASIVTDHMMLEATSLGLGSVWICAFNPAVLREEIEIPPHIEPINILAVGYENCEKKPEDRHSEMRYPLESTVFYESF